MGRPDPDRRTRSNKKGQNVMALPLLIVLAALLLWTLIPEPDQDADPVEPPRQ